MFTSSKKKDGGWKELYQRWNRRSYKFYFYTPSYTEEVNDSMKEMFLFAADQILIVERYAQHLKAELKSTIKITEKLIKL